MLDTDDISRVKEVDVAIVTAQNFFGGVASAMSGKDSSVGIMQLELVE